MSELPDDILELQQLAFRYFLDHTNAENGLVADNTREDSPCSIAATGLGLSCYPVAVNNGWLKRMDAAERVPEPARVSGRVIAPIAEEHTQSDRSPHEAPKPRCAPARSLHSPTGCRSYP